MHHERMHRWTHTHTTKPVLFLGKKRKETEVHLLKRSSVHTRLHSACFPPHRWRSSRRLSGVRMIATDIAGNLYRWRKCMKNTFDIPQRGFQKWRSGAPSGRSGPGCRLRARHGAIVSFRRWLEGGSLRTLNISCLLSAFETTSTTKFTLSSNAASRVSTSQYRWL